MASARQPKWKSRSSEHKEKFQRFVKWPYSDKVKDIGGYYVCQQNEFKINRDSHDGTCVYIGLGRDGKEVAVKCMLTDICQNKAENESEIYGFTKMGESPHVARYLSCVPDRDGIFTYIVLELCEYSLVEYVKRAKRGDRIPYDPQTIIKQILLGLKELHKRGFRDEEMILHRDLKPDNVLVDVKYCIRLADFGISKQIGNSGHTTQHTSGKGNTEWQAAESIPNAPNDHQIENVKVKYNRKSDVQVVGMLAHYVITKGEHPFGQVSYERAKNIVENNPVGLSALTDPVEREFVSWLIQKNMEDRPFADEALKHPYLLSLQEQLNFLSVVADEVEIAKNKSCFVVHELSSLEESYPNGWMARIPEEIVAAFSLFPNQYKSYITSLLRFVRNVKHHFYDDKTPDRIRELMVEPAHYLLHKDRFFTLATVVHHVLRKEAKTMAQNRENAQLAWVNRPNLKQFF